MNSNAILIIARELSLHRAHGGEPFASLPWEELDVLSNAILSDLLACAGGVPRTDVFLYRAPKSKIDESRLKFSDTIKLRDGHGATLVGVVHGAVQDLFGEGYQRVIAVLDNQPLLTPRMFRKLFEQLNYEHECVIVGPTIEGRCYLLGMKADYSAVFDSPNVDALTKPYELLNRLCALPCELFLAHQRYTLENGYSLEQLKRELKLPGVRDGNFPQRTYDVFQGFDKKYKVKHTAR